MLNDELIYFLEKQNIVFVSTADKDGIINLAVKGIGKIDEKGIIYLVDLFTGKTKINLSENPNITIGSISEELFKGWQIKGIAKEFNEEDSAEILAAWDKKILKRVTDRIISNVKKKKKITHSEVHLPEPKYIIEMKVTEVINLVGI